MIKVGKLNATTTENQVILNGDSKATLIIVIDSGDVEISINDNLNYQTYKYGEMIPLSDATSSIYSLYYKTLSGTASVRYWIG